MKNTIVLAEFWLKNFVKNPLFREHFKLVILNFRELTVRNNLYGKGVRTPKCSLTFSIIVVLRRDVVNCSKSKDYLLIGSKSTRRLN